MEPFARFGDLVATDLQEVSHDPACLDGAGWWAVVHTYEGAFTAARFGRVETVVGRAPRASPGIEWRPIPRDAWVSSMTRAQYLNAVEQIRAAIAAGTVYQANICRVLAAPREGRDLRGLADLLARDHPAPHAGVVMLPDHGLEVVSASPELFLRREGDLLESSPIKGTGRTSADLLDKDTAENIMIVDLVRNDIGRVAATGSVHVSSLLRHAAHPGLVHLVSTVQGQLRADAGWVQILEATFPPGSITGAPKSSAVRLIDEIEMAPRGPYCGAVGWVDADARRASLAVGIRTFWGDAQRVYFGTGAGITWGSDAAREWDETELKASRLLAVAAESAAFRGHYES
ncbi:MAG: chorismate-binding protein [Actinomycetia bacterium]|nr:chorismate-binding protein [Actinomycetes bacterium]